MNYQHKVKDFAKRTKHNLQLIRQCQQRGEDAYEVTQLINSCLGLLVLPREHYIDDIPKTPIEELEKNGWKIPKVKPGYSQVKDLNQLISYLRHAIAHFNIEFISDAEDEIRALEVWNNKDGKKDWEAVLDLNELESLIEKLSDMLMEYE